MNAIASAPGARRLFIISLVARLPLAMLSIGLLVHAERLTDSFAASGVVTGMYAIALGIGSPLLGKLVDRRGQTGVLVASAFATAGALGAVALLPAGTPVAVIVALAVAIGLATPPVGASLRTVLPELLPDPAAARAAYALDASASELTWILGPPLVLAVGAAWSTGMALATAGLMLAAGTAAFAAQPASRAWRPAHTGSRPRGGALRTPAMRTLVTILVGVGVLFGAVEVAVTAAAETLGQTTAAGPMLALWGAGSLVGGMLVIRLGDRAHQAAGLTLMLAALTLGHLLLTAAAGSILGLAAVLLVAGAAIAPTYAIVYAMVEEAAPAGTATEAFAWLATAVAIGAAAGAAAAGSLVEQAGPAAAFGLAAAAGTAALVVALLRSTTLVGQPIAAPATA